jgi:hypothetical protein
LLNANKQEFLRQFKQLKTTQAPIATLNQNVKKNQEILNKLWTAGVIDQEGNLIAGKKAPAKMAD